MSDQFLGEIRMFAGNYAPVDWNFCDGTKLSVSSYPALFALIGTTYGGDGTSTFALPDLRSRLPISMGPGPGLTNRSLGQNGGSEQVVLATAQMPTHSHPFTVSTAKGSTSTLGPATVLAGGNDTTSGNLDAHYVTATAPIGKTFTLSANAVGQAGSNQPHANIMQSMAINFIIALQGIYPTSN